MSLGQVFWILMLLWLVFSLFYYARPEQLGGWGLRGHGLFLFALFFLLGWHDFGFIIHQ